MSQIDQERKIDKFGEVYYSPEGIMESFFIDKFNFDIRTDNVKELEQFNKHLIFRNHNKHIQLYKELDISLDMYDNIHHKWNIPEEYLEIDIIEYILELSDNELEESRLKYELEIYEHYDLLDLLRTMKWLIDTVRKKELYLGIGRGSSVASYVLFKLGIHKIDSLKYDIDFSEFLE